MQSFQRVQLLMTTPANELILFEPAKWNETFSEIHSDDLRLLSNSLIQLSIKAARMSAYIDARGGEHHRDLGHEAAVRAQNEVAEKVRQIFQFQQPRADIEF